MGANVGGVWGQPAQTLRRALTELRRSGVRITARSRIYTTQPIGKPAQPDYCNAVIAATTGLAPVALLGILKRLERSAGRERGPVNGPRPLDLDLVCFNHRVIGWPPRRRSRGELVLPHPEAHRRAFVLQPLLDVAPHWVHPVLQVPARVLLRRTRTKPGAVAALP